MAAAAPLLPAAAGAACETSPLSFLALAAAAAALLLRRPEPGGTSRSVPPAVQYRWHVCNQGGIDKSTGGWQLYPARQQVSTRLLAAAKQHLA